MSILRITIGMMIAAGLGVTPALYAEVPGSNEHLRSATSNPLQNLLTVFHDQGDVWGIEKGYRNFSGTPVILRDLVLVDPNTLEGTIEHPYQQLTNPFILRGDAQRATMTVAKSKPPVKGIASTMFTFSVKGAELVGRRGPVIALSSEKSQEFKTSFSQSLEPWLSSGEISDYGSIGNIVMNLDRLEVVNEGGLHIPVARVDNLPERFFPADMNYDLTVPPYGAYLARNVKTVEPQGRVPLQPLGNTNKSTWVSSNLSEYVRLGEGDLWYATINWQNNITSPEKNLTNIGILNNLQPLTWCGDDFYFYNMDGTDNRILRVNIRSGELTELPETKALQKNSLGSPDGRFLFFSDGRMTYSANGAENRLEVFDCVKRTSFSLDATLDQRVYLGKQKQDGQPLKVMPQVWLSPGLFVTNFGWFDLIHRQQMMFVDAQEIIQRQPRNVRAVRYTHIPGTEYLDVLVRSVDDSPESYNGQGKQIHRRYRVHRLTNSAVELPLESDISKYHNGNITWVDENRYVFSRNKGSLSEVGTWLYDLRTKQNKRLTPFVQNQKLHAENCGALSKGESDWRTPSYYYNQHLVLREKNRIIFVASRGKIMEFVSVSLDGGEILRAPVPQKINTSAKLRRFFPYVTHVPKHREIQL